MNSIKAVLKFLNLTDFEGNISLSNLAVLGCLLKVVLAPQLSITEIGALAAALGNYSAKRFEIRKANEIQNDFSAAIMATKNAKEELVSESSASLDMMAKDLEMIKSTHEKVLQQSDEFREQQDKIQRQSEEMKKIISEANLQKAFRGGNKV